MVIRGDDPRIRPAALAEADQESDAIARRNALRRIMDLDARVLKLEQELAWTQRALSAALPTRPDEETTTLDGAQPEYAVNGERH